MKGKANVRKVISYLLMFALIFSTFQFGNMSASYADDGDSTLMPEVVLMADSKELTVDYVNGKHMVQYINMGTETFTIKPDKTYDNGAWSIKNVISSDSSMVQKTTGSGENISYQYNAGTDKANGFTLTIELEKKDSSGTVVDSKKYVVNMYYQVDNTVKFSKIIVSDADNITDYTKVEYDSINEGGYYQTSVGKDTSKVKIEVYDNDGYIVSQGITYNGSSSNTVNVTGGDNQIKITITKGSIQTIYNLVVTKRGEAFLQSLTPSTGTLSPSFNKDVYDYDITVPTTVEKIAFTPVSVDNSSTIKVDGIVVKSGKKSQDISLDEGMNKIDIMVTTKEGEVSTYTVAVTRTPKNRSSYLSALTLSSGTLNPGFNKELLEYSVTVENSVTSIYVTPTAEDANATIKVNDKKVSSGVPSKYINLDEGANKITIKVTDDKDNSSTYILNVSRRYGKDNVNLSSLSLTEGKLSPKFDPETYAYSATVDRGVDKVRVKFTCQNDKAKITINGKEYVSGQESDAIKLDIGANLVTVKVVAEDNKTTTTYKISVIRGDIEGKNDWILVAGEWTFYNGYGQQVKNQWVKYDNKWYHLDINGHMEKGWLKIGDKWYFLNEYGIMQTGWLYEKGYWYYLYGDGSMARNSWITLNGNWYLFNDLGEMQTGWTLFGGKWYFLNEKGVMQKGWITYDKNKYYLNDDGTMRNGWIFTGTTWYYLDSTGKMVRGWQTINGKRYYFDAKGAMKTGMIFLDGRWINLNNV